MIHLLVKEGAERLENLNSPLYTSLWKIHLHLHMHMNISDCKQHLTLFLIPVYSTSWALR